MIGSNNKTRKLEVSKIKRTLAKRHPGFTIARVVGYWKGNEEATALVAITDDEPVIMESITDLKNVLGQEAIAYQHANELRVA